MSSIMQSRDMFLQYLKQFDFNLNTFDRIVFALSENYLCYLYTIKRCINDVNRYKNNNNNTFET